MPELQSTWTDVHFCETLGEPDLLNFLGRSYNSAQSFSASEVTQRLCMTLSRYTNLFIIIFLAHQNKACRQLKIKQEITAVGD